MKPTRASLALGFSMILLAACGGAQQRAEDESSGSDEEQSTAQSTTEEEAPAARDPKIVKLMKKALACKFEDGAFDEECPALKAWVENDDRFADGKGNDTLFSMLADPKLKVRVLATKKSIDRSYFDDKARATKLFEVAKGEKKDAVAGVLGEYVGKVDAEKMDLADELKGLAKHKSKAFRKALASYLISTHQTKTAVAVEKLLLDDADDGVKESAVSALSTGGITPGVEPVCKLLTAQIARTDDLHAAALWAASSSKCSGMKDQVAAELEKRTADPSKITNAVGVKYALAAGALCGQGTSPELKRKGFEIGKRLVDTKVPDPNTRGSALGGLVDCDPPAGEKLLVTLSHDKDKLVSDRAKKEIERLKAALMKKDTKDTK